MVISDTVSYSNDSLLNHYIKSISFDDLVPGDLFQVEDSSTIPCDSVLLWGGAVVSETILTGEAAPSVKTALPIESLTDDDSTTAASTPLRLKHRENMATSQTSSSSSSSATTSRALLGEGIHTSYKIDQVRKNLVFCFIYIHLLYSYVNCDTICLLVTS